MKVLVTGATGLLGRDTVVQCASRMQTLGLARHLPTSPLPGQFALCDLTESFSLRRVVQQHPDISAILHVQAQANVDTCEADPAHARQMNVETTRQVVEEASVLEARLIFLSTVYVFDGTKPEPYDEADVPNPISVYGQSKLTAEQLVLGYSRGMVVRTGTLFGCGRKNFCDWVLECLKAGEPVKTFTDQVSSLTFTEDLARALASLVEYSMQEPAPAMRVLHLSNRGACTRYAFAQYIAELLNADPKWIQPITMTTRAGFARRPQNAALTSRYALKEIGGVLPLWQDAVKMYLRQKGWLN